MSAKICKHCGTSFEPLKNAKGFYCSTLCYFAHKKRNKGYIAKERVDKILELYDRGLFLKPIARLVRTSTPKIKEILEKAGVYDASRIRPQHVKGFSVQVAQEFFVNATGKLKPPLSSADAMKFLRAVSPAAVVALDYALFEEAVQIQDRFKISYWDSAIVAAAKRRRCNTLYSEDLADGQIYDGIRVVNPFRTAAKSK